MGRGGYVPKRVSGGKRAANAEESRQQKVICEPEAEEVKEAAAPMEYKTEENPVEPTVSPAEKSVNPPDETEPAEVLTEQAEQKEQFFSCTGVGIFMSVAVCLLELAFGVFLVYSQLIPVRLIATTIAVLVLLWAIITALVLDYHRTARFVVGSVICVLLAGALLYGVYVLSGGAAMMLS